MTSRPDLMAIDLERQGRFGLCVPLFPAQNADEVAQLIEVGAKVQGATLAEPLLASVRDTLGAKPLIGRDVESILVRARERAVLAGRAEALELEDLKTAAETFIDPPDQNLLALREIAAVQACSDKRFLPARYADANRGELREAYDAARRILRA